MQTAHRRTVGSALRAGLAALAMLLSACSLFTEPERPRLSVELPAAFFLPGDNVVATLRNDSDSPWYLYPACNAGLQRLENGAWVPAYETYCRLVVREESAVDWLSIAPLEVPAGGTAEVTYTLPPDAVLSPHRIVATFYSRANVSGRTATRVSSTFDVVLSGTLREEP